MSERRGLFGHRLRLRKLFCTVNFNFGGSISTEHQVLLSWMRGPKKLKNKSLLACIWQMAGAVDGAKRRDHRAERECHESTLGGASSDDSGATTPRQKLRERRGGRPSESPSTRPGIAYTLAVRYRVRARPAILRAPLSARPSTRVLRAVVLDAATICRTVGAGGATL